MWLRIFWLLAGGFREDTLRESRRNDKFNRYLLPLQSSPRDRFVVYFILLFLKHSVNVLDIKQVVC